MRAGKLVATTGAIAGVAGLVYMVGLILGLWHQDMARALDDKLLDYAQGDTPEEDSRTQ